MNLLASEEIESKGSLDLGLQTRNQSSGDLHTLSNEVVAGDDVEIVELVSTEVVKATTTSTGKRVEIIETHLESLEKQSSSPHALHKEISALCNENKDIEKKIEKQNKITHWILGLMVIGTAIWRFKLASMALGVQKTLNHPLQTLGGMVAKKFKGKNKEEMHSVNPFQNVDVVLPPILGGRDMDMENNVEKSLDHKICTEL